ncbi:hypothetical protein [Bacillus sp. Brlt_9]|uniref:hypothetical protein n=1 Tax=Bacillus sp. Brlt_9 TaxID=3110916 RepID=UPI003F7B91B2
MKKLFLSLFLFVGIYSIQDTIKAEENPTYYNKELKYNISFSNDWTIFSEEMKRNLSPEERKSSPAIFIKRDGSSQMYIRHLKPDNKKYQIHQKIINYVKTTPEKRQNITRELNPVSTELGRKIESYKINPSNGSIELKLKQTSSQFGEINTTVFWRNINGTLIEFEFYHFDNKESLTTEAEIIKNSFTSSQKNINSNINEGTMKSLKGKTVSSLENTSLFSDFINYLSIPYVWISLLTIFSLLLILYIFYRLI